MLSDIYLGAFFIQYAAGEQEFAVNGKNCTKYKLNLYFFDENVFLREKKNAKRKESKSSVPAEKNPAICRIFNNHI